jgi:1-acyl-sn-glycerol-3-phosphate acyltransferase
VSGKDVGHGPTGKGQKVKGGRKGWLYWLVKNLSRVFFFPFFCIETSGLENLPKQRAFILLPKHQRWEDIPLLGIAAPRPLYYIAKYELFKTPLSEWFFKSLGGIPLNRQRPLESRRYLKAAVELLHEGEGVVVFPEGTYYRNKMGSGQEGMVRLILSRLSLPFIPVGLKYSKRRWRTRVQIKFGRALYADASASSGKFLELMMEEIAQLSGLG